MSVLAYVSAKQTEYTDLKNSLRCESLLLLLYANHLGNHTCYYIKWSGDAPCPLLLYTELKFVWSHSRESGEE